MAKKHSLRLLRKMGHRGAFLLFLSLLDILMGYNLTTATAQDMGPLNFILPVHTWGAIWMGVGAFLLTGVFARRDRLHFGVAATLKTGWAAVFVNVWFFQHIPEEWLNIVLWAAFAAICLVVSSWPELYHRDGREDKPDG